MIVAAPDLIELQHPQQLLQALRMRRGNRQHRVSVPCSLAGQARIIRRRPAVLGDAAAMQRAAAVRGGPMTARGVACYGPAVHRAPVVELWRAARRPAVAGARALLKAQEGAEPGQARRLIWLAACAAPAMSAAMCSRMLRRK